MSRTRLPIRATVIAATLLGGDGLATAAAAQGVIGTGSRRAGANVAALVALMGVGAGWLALARSAGRSARNGRDVAIVALVLGIMGVALAGLHLVTTTGGFGTGNGRTGAIVAAVLGLIGAALGQRALARSRPADPSSEGAPST